MAGHKIEEDDVVAFIPSSKQGVKIGLVSKVFDSEDESDDEFSDDEEEEDERLKPDEIIVETYPKGKESRIIQDQVVLLDRTLQVGDRVIRPQDGDRTGLVTGFHSEADLVLLPGGQHVVKSIDINRLKFLQMFDSNSSSQYVLYEGWYGSVGTVHQRISLVTAEGYKGTITSANALEELRDVLWNPVEGSSFDNSIWYSGQKLQGSTACFTKINWDQNFRPPQKVLKRVTKGVGITRVQFTVEKVEIESVRVRWLGLVPISGHHEFEAKPPASLITGEECNKLLELDFFVLQTAQIGDRMMGKRVASDEIQPYSEWKLNMTALLAAKIATLSQSEEAMDVGKPVETKKEPELQNPTGGGDKADETTDSQEEPDEAVASASKGTPRGRRVGVHLRSRNKAKGKAQKRKKVEKTRLEKAKIRKRSETTTAPLPESASFIGEILIQRTAVNVLWKDGVFEERIPSTELGFFSEVLDEHVFQAGDYVEPSKEDTRDILFGYVHKVDKERVATVSWFAKETHGVRAIAKEEVSELDLEAHQDYNFLPGSCVLNMSERPREAETSDLSQLASLNIGQVVGTDLEQGKLKIRWFDNTLTTEFPLDLIIAFDTENEFGSDFGNFSMDEDGSWSDVSENFDSAGSDESDDSDDSEPEWDREMKMDLLLEKYNSVLEGLRRASVEEVGPWEAAEIKQLVRRLLRNCMKSAIKDGQLKGNLLTELRNLTKVAEGGMDYHIAVSGFCGLFVFSKAFERFNDEVVEEPEISALHPPGTEKITIGTIRSVMLPKLLEKLEKNPSPRECMVALGVCLFILIKIACKHEEKKVGTSSVAEKRIEEKVPEEKQIVAAVAEEPVEKDEVMEQDTKKETDSFRILPTAPDSHKYIGEPSLVPSRNFLKALREELNLFRTSLPPGIEVRAYEDRMDLFSCMIVGPPGTPYKGGLFFFDVALPSDYPLVPPLVFYRTFSSEQLNPNLYQEGKVCVSLLGTWSGKGSEVWNPGSNLLQVLVSIQGLILNSEPYYNEAGYESRRETEEFVEKSRRYNEIAVLRNLESVGKIVSSPPSGFEDTVNNLQKTELSGIVKDVDDWMSGNKNPGFPLLPISNGFRLSVNKYLERLRKLLV